MIHNRFKSVATLAMVVLLAIGVQTAFAADIDLSQGVEPAKDKQMVDTAKWKKNAPWTIGFSNISVVNTWRVQMVKEAEYEASKYSDLKELFVTNANGNITKQIADVEDMLAKGIDALVITPASPTALVPVIERAFDMGVPVILFSTTADTTSYVSSVQGDEIYFGEVGMSWLAEAMGGKGNIIGLRGIAGISAESERWQGVENVLKKYPSIKVIGTEFADWAYDKGKIATENLLAAHPNIDGVWSSGGAMTQAAVEAFVAANRKLVPMTGEANNGFVKTWLKHGFPSIAPVYPTWISAEAVKLALKILQGQSVYRDYVINPAPITQKDAANVVKQDFSDSYWLGSHLPMSDLVKLYKGK